MGEYSSECPGGDSIISSAAKNVTAKSEFPVVSLITQILPVTGQIFQGLI